MKQWERWFLTSSSFDSNSCITSADQERLRFQRVSTQHELNQRGKNPTIKKGLWKGLVLQSVLFLLSVPGDSAEDEPVSSVHPQLGDSSPAASSLLGTLKPRQVWKNLLGGGYGQGSGVLEALAGCCSSIPIARTPLRMGMLRPHSWSQLAVERLASLQTRETGSLQSTCLMITGLKWAGYLAGSFSWGYIWTSKQSIASHLIRWMFVLYKPGRKWRRL